MENTVFEIKKEKRKERKLEEENVKKKENEKKTIEAGKLQKVSKNNPNNQIRSRQCGS